MTQPEVSYAPAYYQGSSPFISAYRPPHPPSAPAAYLSEQSSSRHSQVGSSYRHPSEPVSAPDHPNHQSSPLVAQYYHSPSSSQPLRPQSDQPSPVARASFVSSPRLEDHSILTRSSNSSGAAAARKESLTHGSGSWTDHTSYMSNENRHSHGVSRVHKQTFHDDEGSADSSGGEDALLMLFRLSIPVPVFSVAACIYTVGAILFVLLTSPFRLCSLIPKSATLRSRLCSMLAPALHIHERLVCVRISQADRDRSSSTQWIYNEPSPSTQDPSGDYSACGLIAVLLFSAILCIALMLATWVVALFWVFAMILGNPDGTERKDDGRAAVLGVAHWWQRWLGYGRNPLE